MARPLTARSRTALGLPLLALVAAPLVSCSSKEEPTGSQQFGVERIAYLVRQHTTISPDGNVSINVADGMGQLMDYGRYVPGGRLEVRNLATGKVENVIEDYPDADVQSLDISFDATKVVFSMKKNGNDSYHVYWASLDRNAQGKFELHQLTQEAFDDIYPVWVSGGRIAFVTNQPYTEMGTRADEYNHSQAVTQIATVTVTGGDADRKLCSQNLSHTVNLHGRADGRIGFSRWEHLENVNDLKVFAMNPDCTQMIAVAGQHGKTWNSIAQVSETNTPNVYLGIATTRNKTIQSGSLIRIDARAANNPAFNDEEEPKFEFMTPAVPRGSDPSPVGRYRYPTSLPDGRVLVSWAGGFVNDLDELALSAPDFGLYLYDEKTRENFEVVNYADSWELYGRPVLARPEPPVRDSIQNTVDSSVPTVFGSVDVKNTSLYAKHGNTVQGAQFTEATPMDQALAQAKKVRIIEGFSSEASPGTTMFGLTMAEGAAILGEAEVYADGSWLARLPPYVPVHLQPIDEFELAIRNQTTWVQGMPGEDRVCGGCHEDRTKANLPGGQAQTIATGKGAQNFLVPVAARTEYPWGYANDAANPNQIQTLLDQKCTSCHNETTNGSGPQTFYEITMAAPAGSTGPGETFRVPRLDLTSRPITVTYDRETRAWPASYVSIFYPAAVKMEMGMGASVIGVIPPEWGKPSDARGSALVEKLNITSSLDANRTAWALGQPFTPVEGTAIAGGTRTLHPENVGVTLTREERQKLIRTIDMGGQFYARQNSQFAPNTNDPVAKKSAH
jgi:hypothetical protein